MLIYKTINGVNYKQDCHLNNFLKNKSVHEYQFDQCTYLGKSFLKGSTISVVSHVSDCFEFLHCK